VADVGREVRQAMTDQQGFEEMGKSMRLAGA
jgi:hypothetical protein